LVWRRAADDVGLDHEVVSTTNQYKMFDIVTADEDDASSSLDRERFDYCYPLLCIAAAQPFEHGFPLHVESRPKINSATAAGVPPDKEVARLCAVMRRGFLLRVPKLSAMTVSQMTGEEFAKALDRAIERSGKVINAKPLALPRPRSR
jgi:hypothetical protein